MKKINPFILNTIGVLMIGLCLMACGKNDLNESEKNVQNSMLQKRKDGSIAIGEINSKGNVRFTIDTNAFKSRLLEYNLFAEIEKIEIDDTYLTIIGKDIKDYTLVIFQAKLINEGVALYYPNPENFSLQIFSTDTCAGINCSSCEVIKVNKKSKGCICNQVADKDKGNGSCNHTVVQDGLIEKTKNISDIVKTVLEIIKLF